MTISDTWAREVYKNDQGEGSNLTFCGALEHCYGEIAYYWNANTKKKNESSYENIILPAMKSHNDKVISEYTKEDYENVIDTIRGKGYVNNGVTYFYAEASIKNFEKLIYYVVYYAANRGLCDNVLWGSRFDLEMPNEQEKIVEKVRLKKSLTPKQEKKLAAMLLEDVDVPGEWVAVLLMLGLGTRNAEACGLNYGDIKVLEEYPEDVVAWIYKTTIPDSSTLQSSGKTWNCGRIIPVPDKIVDYLKRRKQFLIDNLEEMGIQDEVNVDELPIVCKGYLSDYGNYKKRASAKDVTNAAREIYKRIGMEAKQLAFVEAELVENKLDDVVNEKDATAYLLRRNYATHLQILGLSIAEIQYLIGHDVEDAYESRNEFVDDERLHKMAEKLKQRPLLNVIYEEKNCQEIILKPKEEVRVVVKGNEPLDVLSIKVEGKGVGKVVDCTYTTEAYDREYDRSIDVIGQYHKRYKCC